MPQPGEQYQRQTLGGMMELEMSGTLKDFDGEDLQADAQTKDWAQLVGEILTVVP